MITFTVVRKNSKIIKFYGHGHSGYASMGEDIVCAAISASSQQTAFGIVNYLKIPCHIGQNDETGFLYADLEMMAKEANISSEIFNKLVSENRVALDALLETMLIMLREIEQQYPKNLKIFEKEEEEQC